jgi:metal-sulfur cluster biosynthetic enzyme
VPQAAIVPKHDRRIRAALMQNDGFNQFRTKAKVKPKWTSDTADDAWNEMIMGKL